MNILVTGGAGFIGSHLVDKLIADGHHVTVIDNLSTGFRNQINPKASFIHMDIEDDRINKIIADERPEVVFHLAAQISVDQSTKEPLKDANTNIVGSVNLLNACINNKVKKVIYSSSAAVYGVPEYLPIDENHPIQPISPYGISKHTVEHYLKVYSELYGLRYTVLRYANAYGPRQVSAGEGGVISVFLDKLKNNEIIQIHGDGEQTRDFVYVDDIVSANILAIDRADNEILNICTGKASSVNDLFARLKDLLNCHVSPVYKEERKGDIRHSVLDNKKSREMLNFTPIYDLQSGLMRTLNKGNR